MVDCRKTSKKNARNYSRDYYIMYFYEAALTDLFLGRNVLSLICPQCPSLSFRILSDLRGHLETQHGLKNMSNGHSEAKNGQFVNGPFENGQIDIEDGQMDIEDGHMDNRDAQSDEEDEQMDTANVGEETNGQKSKVVSLNQIERKK